MKKGWIFKGILCVAAAVLLSMGVWAEETAAAEIVGSGSCGENLTWELTADGVLTISGTGPMADYNSGESPWYEDRESITTVHIEEGVTAIGLCAFEGCTRLTEVTLPDSVTSIGDLAFSDCGLTSVVIPDSVKTIGFNAFYCCNSLTDIYYEGDEATWATLAAESAVPETTTVHFLGGEEISKSGTCGENLKWTLSKTGVLTIYGTGPMTDYGMYYETPWCDDNFFYRVKELRIVSGVTSIGSHAFSGCGRLAEVTIPGSVKTIGLCAFYDMVSLKKVRMESGVEEIGESAFMLSAGLAEVEWPDTLTTIGDYAFSHTALSQITIPDSVKTIGSNAFEQNYDLTAVEIGSGVTEMGTNVFYSCPNLADAKLSDDLTVLSGGAFEGCSGLQSVTLGKKLETIGDNAFYGCISLAAVDIPDSVTTIGYNAFEYCFALSEVTFGSGLTTICDGAFYYCPSLTHVDFPEGLTAIGSSAFQLCGLMNVSIPGSVETVESWAFASCYALTGAEIGSGTKSIAASAFDDCRNLAVVSIPASVTEMESTAFYNCRNLSEVVYGGNADSWAVLNADGAVPENVVVRLLDGSGELDAEVSLADVPGGVLVTMEGSGVIRYTLDGSIPNWNAPLYTGPFLLEKAGAYIISARAYQEIGQMWNCGDTAQVRRVLEQAAAPEVLEENGALTLDGDGEIYYTLDLTEIPTTEHYRYTQPLRFGKTTFLKARVIRAGYAPSDVISYTYEYEAAGPISYPDSTYSFRNEGKSFGYSFLYRIPRERYLEIYGNTMGQMIYHEKEKSYWGGSCFGMSATALMFHRDLLALEDYSDQAQTVYELLKPASRKSALTQLIERYQVSQFLEDVMEERDASEVVSGLSDNTQDGEALIEAVRQACDDGEAMILIVSNDTGGEHALVPYRMEEGKIWVYDCAYPGADKYITYYKNARDIYNFSYDTYTYSVAHNRLDTLLEGLENLQSGGASLYDEEAERMLLSGSMDSLRILDEDGQLVTDYLICRETSDAETVERNLISLEKEAYTITNSDAEAGNWAVSAATELAYCAVTVADPNASVKIWEKNGRFCMSVSSETETAVEFAVRNAAGEENTLSVTSTYAEITVSAGKAVQIVTKTADAVINGEARALESPDNETYVGAAVQSAAPAAQETPAAAYSLQTDITEMPDESFVLTAYVAGAGDDAAVYAACYDENGKMTDVRSIPTEAGRTKYVFTVDAETAEVSVFMVERSGSVPLSEEVSLGRMEASAQEEE